MQLRYQVDRIEQAASLDEPAARLAQLAKTVLPANRTLRDLLHGTWLGHPLHPMLTDATIGLWTAGVTVDLIGGDDPGAARTADRLVLLGNLTAPLTALSGMADWDALGKERSGKRMGLVHALSNSVGLALFAASSLQRYRGKRTSGVLLALLGSAAASFGAYLGGHLSYRLGIGVDHTAFEGAPGGWTRVVALRDLREGRLTRVDAAGTPLVLYRHGERIAALADHCAHLAGPLSDGQVREVDGEACVQCPWHASTFALADGRVVNGPATHPQPAFDVRVIDGDIHVRARPLTQSGNGKLEVAYR